MSTILSALLVLTAAGDSLILEQRVDRYEARTMAYLGAERTWFGAQGQRLRTETTDAAGRTTLLFIIRHDERGRESEAIYFEDDATDPDREVFTYSPDGRLKTTTYYYEAGIPSERTESDLDAAGREIRKRYYRANGEQYGEEDVHWLPSGAEAGWDFRYLSRSAGASFRYEYSPPEGSTNWVRRVRVRNEVPERIEVRSVVTATRAQVRQESARFAPGVVSTDAAEASPSFSADGRTMVFARYGAEWTEKSGFIARLTPDGWVEEALEHLGTIYNLAISPDANTIVFSRRDGDARRLFRTVWSGSGWSSPEDLAVEGTYPQLMESGELVYFDSDGRDGAGIYTSRTRGRGFGEAEPLFVPDSGVAFDAYVAPDEGAILLTRCFDQSCESGGEHGLWEIQDRGGGERQLKGLPYAWGVQPVPALGLLVFTDGDDILAVPLAHLDRR